MASTLPHYCIVGGGLSGLSAAYLISLVRPVGSYRLTLLESNHRFGGWIHSIPNSNTGAVYELGPHSARFASPSGRSLLHFVAGLGLADSLVWLKFTEATHKRYIFANHQLYPLNLRSVKGLLSESVYKLICKNMFSYRPSKQPDLTVDDFFRTRFGGHFADYIGSAMTRGIYAGDPRQLSMRACFPHIISMEDHAPNLTLGLLWNMLKSRKPSTVSLPPQLQSHFQNVKTPPALGWSLTNGMQTLTDTLVAKLEEQSPHVSLLTNANVTRLDLRNNRFSVQWVDRQGVQSALEPVDSVFLACPAYNTSKILNDIVKPSTASRIGPKSLPWTDVVVGILELDASTGWPPFSGFGHLVPQVVDSYILGVVYDSVVLSHLDSPSKSVRYTIMLKPYKDWYNLSGQALTEKGTEVCMRVLQEQVKLKDPQLIDSQITLLPSCIPQYPLHHLENIRAFRSELADCLRDRSIRLPGVHLIGFSYNGVGVPDSFQSALDSVIEEFDL